MLACLPFFLESILFLKCHDLGLGLGHAWFAFECLSMNGVCALFYLNTMLPLLMLLSPTWCLCASVFVCISIKKFTHHLHPEFYDWHMMAHNIAFRTLPPLSLPIVSSFFCPSKRRLKNRKSEKNLRRKKWMHRYFIICVTKLSAKLPYKWWHQKLFGYVIGNHRQTHAHSNNFSSVVVFFKLTDRMNENEWT